MYTARIILAGMIVLAVFLFFSCEKEEIIDARTSSSGELEPELLFDASNECESQNYHAHGSKLTVHVKVCATNSQLAATKLNSANILQAIAKRFNFDQMLCTGHDCNNAEKDCKIGLPKGDAKVSSVVCAPTGNVVACEPPEMEFDCSVMLSVYAVNVKCSCEKVN